MKTLRKKGVSLMLIFTILMAVLMPTIVHAEDSSRVQIIMNENAGNKHGTYMVSGGSFGITVDLDSSIAEFVDIGTEIILSVTPDQYHTFKGWYLAEEYEIVAGLMGWRPIDENTPLSTNATYQFTATESYYNIMPVFESKVGHNNIWMTGNGEIAVLYENRDTSEQPNLDGEHWASNGIAVDYIKGDEITLYAKPTTGNYFVGWFITDRAASDPANYVKEPVISTNTTFTYKPGITSIEVDGVEEPLNYITAVFALNSSKPKRTVITEFIARPYDTEEVAYDTDLAEYTASKKWNASTTDIEMNNRWLELFGEVDGVWQYPANTGLTYSFIKQEVTDTEIINKYTITYDQVIVTKASEPIAENTHSVTFDLNYDGAEPFMTIPNITSESKVNAPNPDPSRDGYKFEGWFKDQTGTQPFDFENDTIVTNTVIYAKWTENPQITFQLDGATVSGNVITFQTGETTITATVTGSGYEFDGNNLKVNLLDLNNVKLVLSNNFDNSKMKLKLHDQQELTVTGDGEAIFDGLDFSQDNSPHLGLYVENNGGEQGQTGGTEDITFNITVNDTYALVDINGKSVVGDGDVSQVQDTYTFNNLLVEEAGETDPTKTNVIKITPRFGEHDITECTINNVVYTLESENVEFYDYGWFITVPGADNYVITVIGDANSETQRTIIWVNPDYVPENEEDAEWVKDFTISKGTAKVIEVYDKDGHLVSPDTYIGMDANEYGLHDGFGWVAIYPGSRVVFEFVPDYGYQLTGIAINETPLDAIDGNENMNRFEVIIPEENAGNLHFAATFTKTEDIVKANSGKVESGEITLGNELEGGSAQLTVSDVELSSDKIKGFENAAGEYIISNYLDIDLYNVFYKGKADSEDVWTTKIDELSNEATITLKLADGLTADDIVIVHNVHDGDTYEIIQIESYDPATNTITFKTKSFSNYAIATKTVSTQEDNTNTENGKTNTTTDNTTSTNESSTASNSPKTGDNITMWIGLMLISILGVFGTFKYLRKRV